MGSMGTGFTTGGAPPAAQEAGYGGYNGGTASGRNDAGYPPQSNVNENVPPPPYGKDGTGNVGGGGYNPVSLLLRVIISAGCIDELANRHLSSLLAAWTTSSSVHW